MSYGFDFFKAWAIRNDAEGQDEPTFEIGSVVKHNFIEDGKTWTVVSREEYEENVGSKAAYEGRATYVRDAEGDYFWNRTERFELVSRPNEVELPPAEVEIPVGEVAFPVGTKVKVTTPPWDESGVFTVVAEEEVELSGMRWAFNMPEEEGQPWVWLTKNDGFYRAYPRELVIFEEEEAPEPQHSDFPIGSTISYYSCGDKERGTVISREDYAKAGRNPQMAEAAASGSRVLFFRKANGQCEWIIASHATVEEQAPEEEVEVPEPQRSLYPVGSTISYYSCGDKERATVISREDYAKAGLDPSVPESMAGGDNVLFLRRANGQFTWIMEGHAMAEEEAVKEREYPLPLGTRVINSYRGVSTVITAEQWSKTTGQKPSQSPGVVFLLHENGTVGYDDVSDVEVVRDDASEAEAETEDADERSAFPLGSKVRIIGDIANWGPFTVISREDFAADHPSDVYGKNHEFFIRNDGNGNSYFDRAEGYELIPEEEISPAEEAAPKQPKLIEVDAQPLKLSADSDGRLNIPAELVRDVLQAKHGDKIAVWINENEIVLISDTVTPGIEHHSKSEKTYFVTVRGNIRIGKDVLERFGSDGYEYLCSIGGNNNLSIKAGKPEPPW